MIMTRQMEGGIPLLCSFTKSALCHTMSKAFWASKKAFFFSALICVIPSCRAKAVWLELRPCLNSS